MRFILLCSLEMEDEFRFSQSKPSPCSRLQKSAHSSMHFSLAGRTAGSKLMAFRMSVVGGSRHFAALPDLVAIGASRIWGKPLVRQVDGSRPDQTDLLSAIKLIWVVQSPAQKYSGSLLTQITCISLAIPAQYKGRFAIVTNVGPGCDGCEWRC
jgi:hypothetical protein